MEKGHYINRDGHIALLYHVKHDFCWLLYRNGSVRVMTHSKFQIEFRGV